MSEALFDDAALTLLLLGAWVLLLGAAAFICDVLERR